MVSNQALVAVHVEEMGSEPSYLSGCLDVRGGRACKQQYSDGQQWCGRQFYKVEKEGNELSTHAGPGEVMRQAHIHMEFGSRSSAPWRSAGYL
jgi:hypothetical protein